MNIWIVNHYATPPSTGGSWVRHFYFSKYLRKKGHDVKIFTSSKIHNTDLNFTDGKSLYIEKEMDSVPYTFVKSSDYSGNGIDRIINMISFPFTIYRALKKCYKTEKPDVIYTSSPDLFVAFFATIFARRRKIPLVTEIRDLWPESIVEYNGMSRKNPIIMVLYAMEKWVYKRCDRLIFTMSGGKDYIIDRKLDKVITPQKIHNLNNGVDLDEFEECIKNNPISDTDLDSDEFFKLAYIGSVRFVNNLGQLIDAMAVLKERGREDIQLIIYGDGTEKQQLEQICNDKKLNVKFKGKVAKRQVPYILSRVDATVINVKNTGLTSYGCSWNKLFEYIASEKPILCNFPQKHDLIIENELGISESFSSAEEYADAIEKISAIDADELGKISERARELKHKYDYKTLSENLEGILRDLVGGKA